VFPAEAELSFANQSPTFKEFCMPYINIRITREGATPEQKAQLIAGATELLSRVLNKNPATTFVIIDEVDTDNWGIAGENVTTLRKLDAAKKAGF
jgi:4-oxalocrotonate tautomerase